MRTSVLGSLVSCLVAATLLPASPSAATHNNEHCFTRTRTARVIARGEFLNEPWAIQFYRDRDDRPCLITDWFRYGSIYPFAIREGHPRLGMLDLAATSSPRNGPGVYLFTGYVSPRVARVTFHLDGKTDQVGIIRTPVWSGLRRDLIVHLIKGRRFDRDRSATLRLYRADGHVVRTKTMHRGDFIPRATVD